MSLSLNTAVVGEDERLAPMLPSVKVVSGRISGGPSPRTERFVRTAEHCPFANVNGGRRLLPKRLPSQLTAGAC
jgi:hypothetical protein